MIMVGELSLRATLVMTMIDWMKLPWDQAHGNTPPGYPGTSYSLNLLRLQAGHNGGDLGDQGYFDRGDGKGGENFDDCVHDNASCGQDDELVMSGLSGWIFIVVMLVMAMSMVWMPAMIRY